jgi:hypothetical protein
MGRFLMNLLPSRCGHVPVSATKPPAQPLSYSPTNPSNNYRRHALTRRVPEIAVTFRPTIAKYFTASLSIIQNTHTHTHMNFKVLEFSNTVHITLVVMLCSKMRLRKEMCDEKVTFASR